MVLDRVQKKLPLDDSIAKQLQRSGLIEGRKPNYHVFASVAVATATSSKADYILTRKLPLRRSWLTLSPIEVEKLIATDVPVNVPNDTVNDLVNDPVNKRQQWFLQQLASGKQAKATDIAEHCNVAIVTAKRDIAELRELGLIVFIGPPKTGQYRLKEAG